MEFPEYLSRAWSDHGKNPDATAESIETGTSLCRSADDVNSLVQLTTHLYSEHLRRFTEGERRLREIGKSQFAKGTSAEFTVARAIAAFRLCEGTLNPLEDRMGLTPSDLARALAVATSALAVRDSERALQYLRLALELAATVDFSSAEGLARSLAIAGNNSAASLEEEATLSETQRTLMLLAAETGRKYWEIAGTWLEVERAEVRWACSCLKSGSFDEARTHARLALAVCEQNGAAAIEFFCAFEAMARIEKTAKTAAFQSALAVTEEWFEKIDAVKDAGDREWAQSLLAALKKAE